MDNATLCALKLILHCLDRNIIHHWNARNNISVKLAKKLGCQLVKEYKAYYLKEK